MLRASLVLAVSTAAAVAAPACRAEPLAALAFPEAYEIAFCERLTPCRMFTDAAECRRRTSFFDHQLAGVGKGRIAYDAGAAEACIDDLRALGCDDVAPVPYLASCTAVFTALGELGDDCVVNDECRTGRCELSDGSLACGDQGRCLPSGSPAAGGEGAACGPELRCHEGLYCGAGGACVGRARRGEACDPQFPVSSCLSFDDVCGPGSGLCTVRGSAGAACATIVDPHDSALLPASDTCRLDHHCSPGSTCVPDVQVGGACPVGHECGFGLGCRGGLCDIGEMLSVCEG